MENLQFDIALADQYTSGSQIARVLSESWAYNNVYCPACGNNNLQQSPNNSSIRDFFCEKCHEVYELKSKKGKIGPKMVDGAYDTVMTRLRSETNPNLLLLSYDASALSVTDLLLVPKHFFITDIIERRKPLPLTARRAGWTGCNILIEIESIPAAGKIPLVRERIPRPKHEVLSTWRATTFLRANAGDDARSWLINVMSCIEEIGSKTFSLAEVYSFEERLGTLHPNNKHVREKIRQQLQTLRDNGYLVFKGRGQYEITTTL